jgi:hypothetical protein
MYAMSKSQELEDECDDDPITYPFTQVVPPRPTVTPPTIRERLVLIAIFSLATLLLWIVGRGVFLSTRELWRLL